MTRRGLRELWGRAWCPLRRNAVMPRSDVIPNSPTGERGTLRWAGIGAGACGLAILSAAWAVPADARSLSRFQRVRDDKGLVVESFNRWSSADQRATKRAAVYIARLLTLGRSSLQIKIVPLTRGGGEMRTLFRIFPVVITATLFTGAAFSQTEKSYSSRRPSLRRRFLPARFHRAGVIEPHFIQ